MAEGKSDSWERVIAWTLPSKLLVRQSICSCLCDSRFGSAHVDFQSLSQMGSYSVSEQALSAGGEAQQAPVQLPQSQAHQRPPIGVPYQQHPDSSCIYSFSSAKTELCTLVACRASIVRVSESLAAPARTTAGADDRVVLRRTAHLPVARGCSRVAKQALLSEILLSWCSTQAHRRSAAKRHCKKAT